MSRRLGTGLAVALTLVAAPAAQAAVQSSPSGQLTSPLLRAPFRDVVLPGPNVSSARTSATARARRYPIRDGRGRSVSIAVTTACRATCKSAQPQRIANFLGTVPHGNEMSLLKVELDTPSQIAASCGGGAQACYFTGGNRMLINGNNTPARDGAPPNFVLAHEYGHHLAHHRPSPKPYVPAIDWGTPRWASYQRICQGSRKGRYFPGDQRSRYFQNPGEAFAEAFAFSRFRRAHVEWAWSDSLRPDAGAFAAIRDDVSSPWSGRTVSSFSRRLRSRRRATHSIPTPLDGAVTVELAGPRASQFELRLLDRSDRLLRAGRGRTALRYEVCGQTRVRAVVRRLARGAGRYQLVVHAP